MNPEERLRQFDQPERWDLPLQKRADAFPPRRGPLPLAISFATIAAVAVVGIVLFAGFGSGVKSLLQGDGSVAGVAPSRIDVPWTYHGAVAQPSDDVVPITDVVPTCAASDVSLVADGHGRSESRTISSAEVSIFLIVLGDSACSLDLSSMGIDAAGMHARWTPGDDGPAVPPVLAPHQVLSVDLELDGSCHAPQTFGDSVPLTATLGGTAIKNDGSATVPSGYLCSGTFRYTPPAQLQPHGAVDYTIVGETHPVVGSGATSVQIVVRIDGDVTFDYPDCPVIIAGTAFGTKRAAVSSALDCNAATRKPSGTWAFEVPIPAGASGTGILEWSLPGRTVLKEPITIR